MDVQRNEAEQRYVATNDDGDEAGQLTFEVDDGVIRLLHTAVDDAYEGQGVGGALARRALDDARRDGLQVDPQCGFVASYIERHPEYEDLTSTA